MKKIKRYVPPTLFVLYLAVLLCITVIRPGSGGYRFMGGSLHLTVLADYVPIFHNSIPWFLYLFVGNIVWFLPFGYYLTRFHLISVCRAVFYGFLFSLFIEIMQYVLGTGISEPDDLILNTLGSLLGSLIGQMGRSLAEKRYREKR